MLWSFYLSSMIEIFVLSHRTLWSGQWSPVSLPPAPALPVTLLHIYGQSSLLPSHNRGLKYLLSHARPFTLQKQPSSYGENAFFPRLPSLLCWQGHIPSSSRLLCFLTPTLVPFLQIRHLLQPKFFLRPFKPPTLPFRSSKTLPQPSIPQSLYLSPPRGNQITQQLDWTYCLHLLTLNPVLCIFSSYHRRATPPAMLNSTDPLSWFLPHHYPNPALWLIFILLSLLHLAWPSPSTLFLLSLPTHLPLPAFKGSRFSLKHFLEPPLFCLCRCSHSTPDFNYCLRGRILKLTFPVLVALLSSRFKFLPFSSGYFGIYLTLPPSPEKNTSSKPPC